MSGEFKVKTVISGKARAGDLGDVIKKKGAGCNGAGDCCDDCAKKKAGSHVAG